MIYTTECLLSFTSRQAVCSGSLHTVRVGSRRLPLYPLVIGCLGLLNIILMLAAVAIGIYCEYPKCLLLSLCNATLVIGKIYISIYIYIFRFNKGFV